MDARNNKMVWFSKNVIFVLATLIGAARTQECSIKIAESAFANRTEQYNKVLADLKHEINFKELCLTQIQEDSTAVYFEDALKLCTNSEVDVLQQKWVELNRNITNICEQDCPKLLTLPSCKNMTFLEEIEFSKYERFCESFQKSYACATESLTDCRFGIALYGEFVEKKVISYWTHICNSGCSNIDETIAVITKCLDPFKKMDKSQLCMTHYTFKECIKQSKVLCPEVLKLVRFVYRKYDRVDTHCTTTTTVTTTPLPEATEPLTEAVEPITEIYEIAESSTLRSTASSETTPVVTETPEDSFDIQIEECLSMEDLEVINSAKIDINSVVVYLKLEACLHNITKDTEALEQILATFTEDIQKFHAQIRSEAWQIARQTLQEKSNCPEKKEEVASACSGHGYGLIPCNSVGIPACSWMMTALSVALSTILFSFRM